MGESTQSAVKMSAELKHQGVAVAEERWRRGGKGERERADNLDVMPSGE